MGNTKIKAANDLQKFFNSFRNIFDAIDELQDVGSLEQAGDEAVQHLHDINQQIAEKEAYFSKLLKDRHDELDVTIENSKLVVDGAKKEAQEITRKAANGVDLMLVDAHKEAKKIKEEAQKEVAKASLELGDIQAAIDIAKVRLADIERDTQDRKREHGSITKMIADLKAKF